MDVRSAILFLCRLNAHSPLAFSAKKFFLAENQLNSDYLRCSIHHAFDCFDWRTQSASSALGSNVNPNRHNLDSCFSGDWAMVRYDPLYKQLFKSQRLVEDLLRETLAKYPEFVSVIDFTTLRKIPGEMITEALRKRFVDCVWQVELAGRRGAAVVILEFQSAIDPDMGLRVLVYSSLLLQNLIEQDRNRGVVAQYYPIIVPIVMYNGKPRWNAELDVKQRFDPADRELQPYQPSQRYLLIDEKQWAGPLPARRALFQALMTIIHGNSAEQVASALAAMNAWLDDERDRQLKQDIADLFWASSRQEYREFDKLPEGTTMGELHNALLDSMREWPKEWVEKGRKEGQAEGQAEGARRIFRGLLSQKFGDLPESVSQQIEQADYPQIQKWIGRVINAESLNQILDD